MVKVFSLNHYPELTTAHLPGFRAATTRAFRLGSKPTLGLLGHAAKADEVAGLLKLRFHRRKSFEISQRRLYHCACDAPKAAHKYT